MSALFALILVSLTAADIVPIAPGPGDIFNAGAECVIKWTPDASASWTNMTINLMSGSNSDMQIVSNVDSEVDGTDASLTPYSWRCPEVNPYSSIYFYQFTNGVDKKNSKWTTRFTIASPSGSTTTAEHSAQPNGDPIPWGDGHSSSFTNDGLSADQTAVQRYPDTADKDDTSSELPTSTSTRMKQPSQSSTTSPRPIAKLDSPQAGSPSSMLNKAAAPTTLSAKPTSMPCPGMNSMGMIANDARSRRDVRYYFIFSLLVTVLSF